MEATPVMLAALSPNSDNEKILVRITRVWEAINKHTGMALHTNILLLDEKETQMVAIIRNNQKHLFLPNIEENNVYLISNIKVVPGPKAYRVAAVENSLNFYYRTNIQKQDDTGLIPRYRFEMRGFAEIGSLVGNVNLLIDVMGVVASYGQLEGRENGARKLDIVLKNEGMERMVVTLWEEKAIQFQKAMKDAAKGPLFVVITGLIAKKFSAAPSLSSSDATCSFVNIDYGPLTDMKAALSATVGTPEDLLPTPVGGKFIAPEGGDIKELTISSILDIKVTQDHEFICCLCRAKIVDLLNGNGWFYNCCPKCAKTVRPLEGKYHCFTCAQTTGQVAQRYRIVVQVEDSTGTTTLTLFNKEAERILGVPIAKVLDQQREEGNFNQIPAVVRNMIGKHCLFQMKVTSYNTKHGCEEYTVTKVFENIDLETDKTPTDISAEETAHAQDKKLGKRKTMA